MAARDLREEVARALFKPELLELYPSMRWENLPEDVKRPYLEAADRVLLVVEDRRTRSLIWRIVVHLLTVGLLAVMALIALIMLLES